MKKMRLVITVLILALIFHLSIISHLKTIALLSELFPQSPIHILSQVTAPSKHKKLSLASSNGKIIVDMFRPQKEGQYPAIIIATGVKIAFQDRPSLYQFAQSLSRLGYVVVWPRLKPLDQGRNIPEFSQTFVETFKWLEHQSYVSGKKISIMGFSIGSSTAFVAATHPDLQNKIHSLMFFGGYYDIFDYLCSVATRSMELDGVTLPWKISQETIYYSKENFKTQKMPGLLALLETRDKQECQTKVNQLSPGEKGYLQSLNPADHLRDFHTRIFIMHAVSDDRVPYVESVKLSRNLQEVPQTFLLTNLFNHVRPNRRISFFYPTTLIEYFNLTRFISSLLP